MEQRATDNTKQTDAAGTTKPLHEKITEAIQKDDDLLSRLLKTLSHPVVMIVGILALLYWYHQQQKSESPKNRIKADSQLAKLKKKNKKLKKRIKKQSLTGNGSGKSSIRVLG